MKMFEFSIIASGLDPKSSDFESRFYSAGCDDATVSFQKGHIILDFAREADSFDAAVASAMNNVVAAGAAVERVEPDPLVSLSEIASRTGLTRAALSNYAKGSRAADFPAPIARVTSDSPLWDWSIVAVWMFRHRKISREAALQAGIVKSVNDVLPGSPKKGSWERFLKRTAHDCEAAL